MSYLYNNNPYNRRRPASPTGAPAGGGLPTLEDYQKLARAFEELKLRTDEQAKQLKDKTTELTVKDEALHRQAAASQGNLYLPELAAALERLRRLR